MPTPLSFGRRFALVGIFWMAVPGLWCLIRFHDLLNRLRGRRRGCGHPNVITVFQAYMVGDLFMALPALKILQDNLPQGKTLQVLCRPDCEEFLRRQGYVARGFKHPWFASHRPAAFWASLRQARALRGEAGASALDTYGDPRTAFLLRIMGICEVVSYRHAHAAFFTNFFALPPAIHHQVDRNTEGAKQYLEMKGWSARSGKGDEGKWRSHPVSLIENTKSEELPRPGDLLISAWTRKDTKNWPLPYWDKLLTLLLSQGIGFSLIDPPDGDEAWRTFAQTWQTKVPLLRLSLLDLWHALGNYRVVVTQDNFLGHMAASAGKPVFWLNGSSDPGEVSPKGPLGQYTEIMHIEDMPCRPCAHRCTEVRHAHCLTDLPVEAVWPRLWNFIDRTGQGNASTTAG